MKILVNDYAFSRLKSMAISTNDMAIGFHPFRGENPLVLLEESDTMAQLVQVGSVSKDGSVLYSAVPFVFPEAQDEELVEFEPFFVDKKALCTGLEMVLLTDEVACVDINAEEGIFSILRGREYFSTALLDGYENESVRIEEEAEGAEYVIDNISFRNAVSLLKAPSVVMSFKTEGTRMCSSDEDMSVRFFDLAVSVEKEDRIELKSEHIATLFHVFLETDFSIFAYPNVIRVVDHENCYDFPRQIATKNVEEVVASLKENEPIFSLVANKEALVSVFEKGLSLKKALCFETQKSPLVNMVIQQDGVFLKEEAFFLFVETTAIEGVSSSYSLTIPLASLLQTIRELPSEEVLLTFACQNAHSNAAFVVGVFSGKGKENGGFCASKRSEEGRSFLLVDESVYTHCQSQEEVLLFLKEQKPSVLAKDEASFVESVGEYAKEDQRVDNADEVMKDVKLFITAGENTASTTSNAMTCKLGDEMAADAMACSSKNHLQNICRFFN